MTRVSSLTLIRFLMLLVSIVLVYRTEDFNIVGNRCSLMMLRLAIVLVDISKLKEEYLVSPDYLSVMMIH